MGISLYYYNNAKAGAAAPAFICRTTARTTTSTTTPTTTRSERRWQQQQQQQHLPKLQPRPQPPSNTQLPLFHHHPCSPPKTIHHPIKPIRPNKEYGGGGGSDDSSGGVVSVSTATDVLRLMDGLRLPVHVDLYASLLKECTDSRDAAQGAEVHAHIRRSGSGRGLQGTGGLLLANRLLLMYAASGRAISARELFEEMPTRDSISWAAVVASLSDAGDHRGALLLFAEMMHEMGSGGLIGEPAGVSTVVAVLRSCTRVKDLKFGEFVHGLVLKMGGCDATNNSSRLGSSLIRFYGMLGQQDRAERVFNYSIHFRDSIVWTAMVVAYCRRVDLFEKAVQVFKEMGMAGKRKNSELFSNIFKACGRRREGRSGRQLHADAIKVGAELDVLVRSSLVEMYGQCGLLHDARTAFETGWIDR